MREKLLSIIAFVFVFMGGTSVAPKESVAGSDDAAYYTSGFLLGVHGGVNRVTGNFKAIFNDGLNFDNSIQPASGCAHRPMGFFGGLLGYRYVFQNGFTLGIDVTGNYTASNELGATLFHAFATIRNRLKKKYAIIPSIKMGGIIFDRYHVYGGLGLAISRFTLSIDNIDAPEFFSSKSFTKVGIVPSIGVEHAFTPWLYLSGELSYEAYKEVETMFGSEFAQGLPQATYNSKIRPRVFAARLGLVLKL